MASSILNSDDGVISGTSGLKSTGGDDGVLVFQSKGTETARINTDKQIVAAAGTASLPIYSTTGDLNTGIFFPAADTIAFAEGGAEAMRITSDARVGINTVNPIAPLSINLPEPGGEAIRLSFTGGTATQAEASIGFGRGDTSTYPNAAISGQEVDNSDLRGNLLFYTRDTENAGVAPTERMRIDSSGNVGIGTTSPGGGLDVFRSANSGSEYSLSVRNGFPGDGVSAGIKFGFNTSALDPDYLGAISSVITNRSTRAADLRFYTAPSGTLTERARITSGGNLLVGTTSGSVWNSSTTQGVVIEPNAIQISRSGEVPLLVNRITDDGQLVRFAQAGAEEGNISVSGNTVSYNAFCGGHWTQLKEGRGYNPDIPRGTVMSSIGEMAVWKSVEWTETIEHPAIDAVEAVEAVLDEDGNVIEPAVEAVEGKEAWTETFNKREAYLGNLDIGAIFEEDGFTKTVVDDGNERLPKVKISDVVGDKAVYGVFQTWDEVEDMLISSLGAFVVRIAAGVTVEIGDLLESNGDGCAKVQDDDIIRSKTIGKVTSTVATDTYDDGSYTVPCVLYCG